MSSIELIVARAENGVIGAAGAMPWHIPEDLRRFKKLTLGHPIIMGRKTWESLPTKPLPERKNIILTSRPFDAPAGAVCVANKADAIAAAEGATKIMIIGGAEIYKLFEPDATKIHLTEIDLQPDGDTFFNYEPAAWRTISDEPHDNYNFKTLERI